MTIYSSLAKSMAPDRDNAATSGGLHTRYASESIKTPLTWQLMQILGAMGPGMIWFRTPISFLQFAT